MDRLEHLSTPSQPLPITFGSQERPDDFPILRPITFGSQDRPVDSAALNENDLLITPSSSKFTSFNFCSHILFTFVVNTTAERGIGVYPTFIGLRNYAVPVESLLPSSVPAVSYAVPNLHQSLHGSGFSSLISPTNRANDDTPVPLGPNREIVMHLISLRSLRNREYIDEGAISAFLNLISQRSETGNYQRTYSFPIQLLPSLSRGVINRSISIILQCLQLFISILLL